MKRTKRGSVTVAFFRETSDPDSDIRAMIAQKYPLRDVYEKHKEALGGCSYSRFVVLVHRELGDKRKPPVVRQAPSIGPSSYEHQKAPTAEFLASLTRRKPTNG